MRSRCSGVAILVLGCGACNYTDGECWPRSADGPGSGAGGSVLLPGGGGFGDVPPKPQDASEPPPPDCLIAAQGACYEKCLADYENAAAACGKIADASQRTTCQTAAHVNYGTCRARCANDPVEKCKELCDEIMDKCKGDCKNDPNPVACRGKCMEEYGKCLKRCEGK